MSTNSKREEGWITGLAPNTIYNFTINCGGGDIMTTQQTTDNNGSIHYKIEYYTGDWTVRVILGEFVKVGKVHYISTNISWTPV